MYTINIDKMTEIMHKRHWCVADVAALTGISHYTISRLMKRHHSSVYLDTAAKLAKVLEIPIQDFIVECNA